MSKQVEFGAIDSEAIEYRNEYRHTKAVFAFVASLAWMWAPLPPSLSLERFDWFCDDLTERWRSAIGRYQGYAKGTSARQPERCLKTRETLKAQREEALLNARSPSENQKAVSIRRA